MGKKPFDNILRYTWSQYTGSIAMSELEIAQNRGDSQIVSLMKAKADQLQMIQINVRPATNCNLFSVVACVKSVAPRWDFHRIGWY